MEALGALGTFFLAIIIVGFAIGSFFALPMIWYHVGQMNKKMENIIGILEYIAKDKK